MPGLEEPEQAPPSPDYIPGPEHAGNEIVAEDQPYAEDASPIAQSPEYIPESDFEMHPEDDDDDPEEDPIDYPADEGDDGDDEEEQMATPCHGCGQPCDGYYCESCMCPSCGMTLFNGICDNCIYGAGMPIKCTECGGIEPSYNQNYDDNYYPHESPSYHCCDYCGGSHKTFQCQPDKQNVDFSGSDQIQTPQYPDVNPPSPEISNEENFQAKGDLMTEEVPEEQKQKIKDTMFDLVKICHHKQFLCIHDDVDDLIESPLHSKLLSINSINSQCLDKKEQEVKIVEEQPAEHRNHIEKSLHNFRVIHKSSISINTSQISSIHSVAPILSTKKPKNSLCMGYEHLSITPKTESDEFTESNAENLLPIPSECEVTLEDERKCDELICENSSTIDVCDNHSEILFDSNNDDLSSDDEIFKDTKYEEVDLEDISQIQDVVLREKLLSVTCLIYNIESLNDNSTPDRMLNSFESDNSLLDNFSPEFETFCDHSEETRSGSTTHANYSLLEYDSFCFEIKPDQEKLINLVENDNSDNSSNDPLLEEADLFLSDDSIPPGIENIADDPEGDVHVESFFDLKPDMIAEGISDKLNEDKCFDSGSEINVSTKIEDDDYFPFMFVIRFFLPYFIFPVVSPLLLSAESEDTIFDPGRSFLRTDRALIDVYGEEITLRVNDEVVTYNFNQTTRYSSTYDDLSANRIDIIDVAREEYA
nr:reverse transcriptase domain-containing protein [Tanacetum cinerariifolium]